MCVIACYENDFPLMDDLVSMESMNQDGAGIAYIKDDWVHWEKGINAKRISQIIEDEKVKKPFVVHFRIASVGGKDKQLCHPFPIEKDVPLKLKGKSKHGVLFHNGTWTEYKEIIQIACLRAGVRVPDGKISDSRIMAWLAHNFGVNFLQSISGQKMTVLTPKGIQYFGNFEDFQNDKVSNTYFDRTWTFNNGFGYQDLVRKSQGLKVKNHVKPNKKAKKIKTEKIPDQLDYDKLTRKEKSMVDDLQNLGFDFNVIEEFWFEYGMDMEKVHSTLDDQFQNSYGI